jgi:hypothetical protein
VNSHPRCSVGACRRRADAVHFVDGSTTPERIARGHHARYPRRAETTELRWSCPAHDVGAYRVGLAELGSDPVGWLHHLSQKSWRGDLVLSELAARRDVAMLDADAS